MNNYRLSTNTASSIPLSKDEWDKLYFALPTVKYLFDGRVRDISYPLWGEGKRYINELAVYTRYFNRMEKF